MTMGSGVFYSHYKITQCRRCLVQLFFPLYSILYTVALARLVVASSCVNREERVNLFVGVRAVVIVLVASQAVVKKTIAADSSHTTERKKKKFGFS